MILQKKEDVDFFHPFTKSIFFFLFKFNTIFLEGPIKN